MSFERGVIPSDVVQDITLQKVTPGVSKGALGRWRTYSLNSSQYVQGLCKSKGYVRGYGIFSNRLKGDFIPQIRKLLKKKNKQRKVKKEWRERLNDYTGHDPLCCDNCGCEMILFYVCYGPEKGILKKLGLHEWERIPIKQFQIQN